MQRLARAICLGKSEMESQGCDGWPNWPIAFLQVAALRLGTESCWRLAPVWLDNQILEEPAIGAMGMKLCAW